MRLDELFPDLTFRSENRGAHHGQSDMTLFGERDGQYVGHIDYVIFRGEISVQMIDVPENLRRNGYATALVRHLQSMYPDNEIDMGGTTDLGSKFLDAIPKTIVNDDTYHEKKERLDHIKARLAQFDKMADRFYANPSDEGRAWFNKVSDEWNAMNDEEWQLEQEFRDMKPSRTFYK